MDVCLIRICHMCWIIHVNHIAVRLSFISWMMCWWCVIRRYHMVSYVSSIFVRMLNSKPVDVGMNGLETEAYIR